MDPEPAAPADHLPAAPADANTTPMSDREETGSLRDALPGRTDPLTLPEEEREEDNGSAPFEIPAFLFPPELWSVYSLPWEPRDEGSAASGKELSADALTPDVMARCFGPETPPCIQDPFGFLKPEEISPLLDLLHESFQPKDHFEVALVVLGPDTRIPVALNPSDLLQRWFGPNRSLLVLYFLGRPERTQAFFSRETRELHRIEDLRQIIDFGAREAGRLPSAVPQLERFCYKTVIRLDRLYRSDNTNSPEQPLPVAAVESGSAVWWILAVGIQAATIPAGVWWWRRRRRPLPPCYFPDQENPARLGAPHSGGAGTVVSIPAAVPSRFRRWFPNFGSQGG